MAFDRDGVTGHPDHRRATEAAMAFGSRVGLPVLGWALPQAVASALNAELDAAFSGYSRSAIDLSVRVDRERQRSAIALHRSQALPGQALWRRLELSGAYEHARWQDGAPSKLGPPRTRESRSAAGIHAAGVSEATTAATQPTR